MRPDRRPPDLGVAARVIPELQVHPEPTSTTDGQIRALYDRGYSERGITDVVGVVSLNIHTKAFNLAAGLTPHRPSSGRRPLPPVLL
ncbi:hypothetical protein M8J71_02545 [Pseudarthrobacter sp. R1]|uniref:hypothetical protein n=1 Tax=Pseudarthrobacter sp. R1 TaxID=2944934 RepID=UPI002108C40F|nr:hypothetical protein [Pseudarthrobacter sp. R1]MCQ6269376.1 hypothetical protein [Pseudarthrobacter sp. R1]